MIVLTGFTRYPIFYSSNGRRIIGYKSSDEKFNEYVYSIREPSVVVHTLADLRFRSRFVVFDKRIGKRAVNPFLKLREYVPYSMYVYPDDKPTETFSDAYCLGITLKGARTPVYVPLICLRMLTREEVDAFLRVATVKEVTVDRFTEFMRQLGIEVEKIKELPNNRSVLRISDPEVSDTYMVVVDSRGLVLDKNFCMEMAQPLYLPELIMLTRERKDIYVFSSFEYV